MSETEEAHDCYTDPRCCTYCEKHLECRCGDEIYGGVVSMSQATPESPSDDGPADCVNCGERIRRFGQTRRWCHDQTGNVQCSPEWWGVAEAASHCGIRPGTWRDYVARGRAPQPDDPDEGAPKERRRPRWRADTVRAWQASRPRATPTD